MKIGITERGDPSIDFSWVEQMEKMDGVILITKNLTDKVIESARPYFDKMIFHVTCTGYGQTVVEPNIPRYTEQLSQAQKLLSEGVSPERVVIRIDPIIPTEKGLKRAEMVFEEAIARGFSRFRVSIMDAYPHVRERFRENNIDPPYGDYFTASYNMMFATDDMFKRVKSRHPHIVIESCAEGKLHEIVQSGCVSEKDISMLGLKVDNVDNAGYQRKGCLCCSAKTELLSEKKQCPYKCMYCYWRN